MIELQGNLEKIFDLLKKVENDLMYDIDKTLNVNLDNFLSIKNKRLLNFGFKYVKTYRNHNFWFNQILYL